MKIALINENSQAAKNGIIPVEDFLNILDKHHHIKLAKTKLCNRNIKSQNYFCAPATTPLETPSSMPWSPSSTITPRCGQKTSPQPLASPAAT